MSGRDSAKRAIEGEIRYMAQQRYAADPAFGNFRCEHHKQIGYTWYYVNTPGDTDQERTYKIPFRYCPKCNRAHYSIPKGLVEAVEAIWAWAVSSREVR